MTERPGIDPEDFRSAAVRYHFLSASQWSDALEHGRRRGLGLDHALVDGGFLTSSQLSMISEICASREKEPGAPAPAVRAWPTEAGPYRLKRCLSAGKRTAVYEAEGPCGTAAIKLVAPSKSLPVVECFLEEAETYRKVRHPNLVPIIATGSSEGWGWAAMPLVDGRPLVERVSAHGPLGTALAVRAAAGSARGLAAAHEAGLLHLDVKPDNILADPTGRAQVTDFGLGWRKLDRALGTPSYMAPERCLGLEGDERSDVYGLGVTLFFLLTGKRPFPAKTPEDAMLFHVKAQIRFPEKSLDVPRPLVELVGAMTAKEPGDRTPGMKAVVELLEAEFPLFTSEPGF